MEFFRNDLTKSPVARKLAVRHLVFWLLVVSNFNYFKMYAWSVYKNAVVAAFCIYAEHGEDAAKRGGWGPCIK